MTPIYFPYSIVSKKTLTAIGALGRKPWVYLPAPAAATADMQQWAQQGLVELHLPPGADDHQLQALLKEYRSWSELHAGSRFAKTALMARQTADAQPFSERFVSQLKTDIQRKVQDPEHRTVGTPAGDSTLAARLFLCFAHDLDLQRLDLASDLETNTQLERYLMQNLHGTPEEIAGPIAPSESIPPSDTRDYMVAERVRAWSRIFVADAPTWPAGSWPLFVTDHSGVTDTLQEHLGGMERRFHVEHLPVDAAAGLDLSERQASLQKRLEQEVRGGPHPDAATESEGRLPSGHPGPSMTLFKISRQSPHTVFQRIAGDMSRSETEDDSESMHTLIGLIGGECDQRRDDRQ